MSDPIDAINQTVLDEFTMWLKQPQIEGFVPHPYCDDGGVVTAGSGLAFFSPIEMQSVTWVHKDGSMADSGSMNAAYTTCRGIWHPGCNFSYHAYEHASDLILTDAANERGVRNWLASRMGIVLSYFPDFTHYPDGVQTGILDMSYNCGPNIFKGYPHFMSYIHALDWAGASKECATSGKNQQRNIMRAKLFADAA